MPVDKPKNFISKLRRKFSFIHGFILFLLLLSLPITNQIDKEYFKIARVFTLLYIGSIGAYIFLWAMVSYIRESGMKPLLLKVWIYISLFIGILGIYIIMIHGLADNLWAVPMVIYGAIVFKITKDKILD